MKVREVFETPPKMQNLRLESVCNHPKVFESTLKAQNLRLKSVLFQQRVFEKFREKCSKQHTWIVTQHFVYLHVLAASIETMRSYKSMRREKYFSVHQIQ